MFLLPCSSLTLFLWGLGEADPHPWMRIPSSCSQSRMQRAIHRMGQEGSYPEISLRILGKRHSFYLGCQRSVYQFSIRRTRVGDSSQILDLRWDNLMMKQLTGCSRIFSVSSFTTSGSDIIKSSLCDDKMNRSASRLRQEDKLRADHCGSSHAYNHFFFQCMFLVVWSSEFCFYLILLIF